MLNNKNTVLSRLWIYNYNIGKKIDKSSIICKLVI